jgi:hypothetical protein
MKGIYLTEEGKQEIEAKIAALDEFKQISNSDYEWNELVMEQNAYKKILSSAIILPVSDTWEKYVHPALVPFFEKDLKNGVIIQPKL